jgi:hypothetical protein
LIRKAAEERGFTVELEKVVLDGHGHVDIAIDRNGLRIACEISVTTSPKHEIDNLCKCLAAGFDYAVLVSSESSTLRLAKKRFVPELTRAQRDRVRFLTPAALAGWLDEVRVEAFERVRSEPDHADADSHGASHGKKPALARLRAERKVIPDDGSLLNPEQAAAYLRRAPQTLAKMRSVGGGPPFYKVGRNVYYKREDLDAWLDGRRRRSTSDSGSKDV